MAPDASSGAGSPSASAGRWPCSFPLFFRLSACWLCSGLAASRAPGSIFAWSLSISSGAACSRSFPPSLAITSARTTPLPITGSFTPRKVWPPFWEVAPRPGSSRDLATGTGCSMAARDWPLFLACWCWSCEICPCLPDFALKIYSRRPAYQERWRCKKPGSAFEIGCRPALTAARAGYLPLLEVSTKSDDALGQHLSAFHLRVHHSTVGDITLECAFQGSKVFEGGGPYTDLYRMDPKSAKRDHRLQSSGRLIGFRFGDFNFPLEPKTAFYDGSTSMQPFPIATG